VPVKPKRMEQRQYPQQHIAGLELKHLFDRSRHCCEYCDIVSMTPFARRLSRRVKMIVSRSSARILVNPNIRSRIETGTAYVWMPATILSSAGRHVFEILEIDKL